MTQDIFYFIHSFFMCFKNITEFIQSFYNNTFSFTILLLFIFIYKVELVLSFHVIGDSRFIIIYYLHLTFIYKLIPSMNI